MFQDKSVTISHQRVKGIRIIIITLFALLFVRYYFLQIIRGPEYFLLSEMNRLRITKSSAPRGTITDRNGVLLATNRPSYNIVLYRHNIKKKLESIAEFLRLSPEFIQGQLKRYANLPISEPIILKEDIPFEDVAQITPRLVSYPDLSIEVEPLRFYHLSKEMVHILGYVGEISEREIDRGIFPQVTSGELVGKNGIEKKYDAYLRGVRGEMTDVVDSSGSKVENILNLDPKPGSTLRLSIDSELQKIIVELMYDKVGAIAAIAPQSGEVLAMVSSPPYDPNLLAGRFTREKWRELTTAENDPLQNRNIQNSYSPGSMFKIVIALAGLQEKIVKDNTAYTCYGSQTFYRKPFRCNKTSGHGRMELYDAIRQSCNIFFYNVGNKLTIENIAKYSRRYGFGFKTDVDLVNEKGGLVPDEEWKQRTYREPWYPGETISVSIGQGAMLVTPLQQVTFIAAVANGGKVLRPFLVKEIKNSNGDIVKSFSRNVRGLLGATPEDLDRVKRGMWGVVNDYGTGWGAKLWGKDVAGKTGTAQVVQKDMFAGKKEIPWKFRNHSWFSCFAPLENPEIALVVLVEHGGDGSVMAAPLAGKILREYFKIQKIREKKNEASE